MRTIPTGVDMVIVESLDRYVKDRIPTGSFLRAVLENDLREAFGRADDRNIRDMFHIVSYCYNKLPGNCWGSKEVVQGWLDRKDEK
jgi:hypothetical protein